MAGDMSESVKFVVYYGPGNVRTNESGVDLTEFAYVELQLTDPEKVNISQLKHWLTTNFSLDPNVCTVSIQSVWTKSRTKIFWELVPIDRTHKWVTWLESCKRRRTHPVALVLPIPTEDPLVQGGGGYEPGHVSQPIDEMDVAGSEHMGGTELEGQSDYVSHVGGDYDAGESSQNIGDPDSGEADGDEEESEMQNLMEEEDEDGLAEDLDSENSNEEDGEENDEEVPIPASWNQNLSTGMTVNDGHESSWEYHRSKVEIGGMYTTKKNLKAAVTEWAMSTQRIFQTDVSTKKYLTLSCIINSCPAKVHAHVPKWDVTWVVTKVVPHNCVMKYPLVDHPNLTSSLIAEVMFSEIVEKKDMEAKHIQNAIKSRYNYEIPYGKAWRAKQRAMEKRFGTFIDSYDNVIRLLHTLQARNPGTHVDIQHFTLAEFPDYKVLHRVFFSFAICIKAFSHCLPVLCVDGTFLTGKYRGQILTAIGVDGNNQILPIAMAFVEGENLESWLWFFRQLKIAIVKDRPNVCILHDRHPGILAAIRALQTPGSNEPAPWQDMQSRWCMRHLGANFYSQFKNKRLMNMFKKLCAQNQQKKYDFLWKKLDEFTKAQVKERRAAQARQPTNTELEPMELCDLPAFDPPGTKRKKGRAIKKFSEWIEKEPPVKWSLLHDTHGARYGTMTTNLAEVYNFVLRGNRGMPLTAIVEGVFHGTVRYFRDRRLKSEKHIKKHPETPYCEKIMRYMAKKLKKAKLHTVTAIGNQERRYEVRLPTDRFGSANELKTHEVKIGSGVRPTCECTCNKPKLLHLPCSHVLAACGQLKMDAISFVSQYYLKESVQNAWTGEMDGFRVMGNFNTVNPGDRQYIPDPEKMRTSRGRRKVCRIRNDMDESEAGGCTRQCLLCAGYGHRMKYCPTLTVGGDTAGASTSTATTPVAATSVGRRGRGRGSRGRRGGRG